MATPVKMPKMGMTMTEGTVREWIPGIGDAVEKGRTILVIESEKAEIEVEATASGIFRHVYVDLDATVACGTLLAAITETADEPFDAEAFAREHRVEPAATPVQPAAKRAVAAAGPTPAGPRSRTAVAPAARARARELGLDPAQVPGTGPGGRVTKRDVEAFAARREELVTVAEGVALEVPVLGEGEPVLLLPGFGTDASSFALVAPGLAEGHRVFGVNPRGVGRSDAPASEAYAVVDAAGDAAAVQDAPAHVIGASLGAAAAIELALSRPERVRSLTLITPFVEASPRLRAVAEAWCGVAAEASARTLARALLPWLFSSGYLDRADARERTLRGLAASLARVPAATLERQAAGLRAWSGSRGGDLGRIRSPTLVLVAGGDLLTPDAEAVGAAIPGAKTQVVPEAGHALAIEAAEAVGAAIRTHLAAVDSG